MCAYVYMYVYAYVCLCRREMNDRSDMREGRQELGLFCYYKVLKLPMKWT